MSKTLAEIATEARKSYETSYEQRGHYDPNWRAKCDAYVANAIIEECAKVAEADDSFMMLQDWGLQNAVTQKGENIAQAIRALKSASQEGSNG